MKNPTGVEVPIAQAHGANATYQYSMTANEDALALIISEIFAFKPSMGAIQLLKETMNTRLGTSL